MNWTLLKFKNFCSLIDTIKRIKRQVTDQKKIFVFPISEKEFVSEIYRELSKLNYKKTTQYKNG